MNFSLRSMLLAFLLSLIYGVIFSTLNGFIVSRSYISDPGWFPLFIYLFLLILLFHAVLCVIQFFSAKFLNRVWGRIIFSLAGLLWVLGFSLFLKEWGLLILLLSVALFLLNWRFNENK